MKYDDKTLQKILVDGKYIEKKEFDEALEKARKNKVLPVPFLIENNYITTDLFGQAVAESFSIAYADLNSRKPDQSQVLKIPESVAIQYKVVLFDGGEKEVVVTTSDPQQQDLPEILSKIFTGKKIHIAFSLPEDIDAVLMLYQKSLTERIEKVIKNEQNPASYIIDEIFNEALAFKTSDIHIEPLAGSVRVRLRIDGVLQEKAKFLSADYESILNRLKVLSKLRIDEHMRTQDGSIRYVVRGQTIDFRISIVPTLYGEKVVARVLTSYVKNLSLEDLGLDDRDKEVVEDVAQKPFGMIINVGPTGAGKTTTLYSIMHLLNKPEVNITTIEDPVEYRVNEINQIQVNASKKITFSKGLRSIVRQDPDIILVGEIRDVETAEIAVNAALTGHLLLSTFHANDAATTIPRLLDMDVEPFLLASTLELVVAQRLVRKVCDNCRVSVKKDLADFKKFIPNHYFGKKKTMTLYEGKGCNACRHTGYDGRIAIFEHIKVTPEMKDLILSRPSSRDIWKLALKQGSRSMFEDGLEKVKNGTTTIEELLRVAKPPEYEEPK